MFHDREPRYVCFTVCFFISPDLDGNRAPEGTRHYKNCATICFPFFLTLPRYSTCSGPRLARWFTPFGCIKNTLAGAPASWQRRSHEDKRRDRVPGIFLDPLSARRLVSLLAPSFESNSGTAENKVHGVKNQGEGEGADFVKNV
jgi:hypothetical protein